MSATVQPKEQASVEQLESRIVQVVLQFLSFHIVLRLLGCFLVDYYNVNYYLKMLLLLIYSLFQTP